MSAARKEGLLAQTRAHVEAELTALETSLRAAEAAATHEDAKPENKYDTRGLEASYLAGAQKGRAAELRGTLDILTRTRVRNFQEDDAIGATALIGLDEGGEVALYFLTAVGAGATLALDGRAVMAITPQSPLGRSLLGKRVGDVVTIELPLGAKDYEIVSLE